jgi:hypothetical protein
MSTKGNIYNNPDACFSGLFLKAKGIQQGILIDTLELKALLDYANILNIHYLSKKNAIVNHYNNKLRTEVAEIDATLQILDDTVAIFKESLNNQLDLADKTAI